MPHAMLVSAMQLPHGYPHYVYIYMALGLPSACVLSATCVAPPVVVLLAFDVAAATVCGGTTCLFAVI